MDCRKITVAITSLMRFGYLSECLRQLQAVMPECPIIVADDSPTPPAVPDSVKLISLPYDSGLTVKRNAIVRATTTPYFLMYCDDWATDADTRRGIEKMFGILEEHSEIDVAGGRHPKGRPYEGFLEYKPGEYIREHPLGPVDVEFAACDLTVNYFLTRTEVPRQVPWDEDIVPIGGEHVVWFLDLKKAGKKVVVVPDAGVNCLPGMAGGADDRYNVMRRRAFACGHTIMKKKFNIKQYIGFDGGVS